VFAPAESASERTRVPSWLGWRCDTVDSSLSPAAFGLALPVEREVADPAPVSSFGVARSPPSVPDAASGALVGRGPLAAGELPAESDVSVVRLVAAGSSAEDSRVSRESRFASGADRAR
jgi:hypothetical protein